MARKSTVQYLWDAVFPRRCAGCRILLPTSSPLRYLCRPCRRTITPVPLRCAFCTAVSPQGSTCRLCHGQHALDALLVAANYNDELTKRVVKLLKYRFATLAAYDMGDIMADDLVRHGIAGSFDAIVPIPLHPSRLRWRGFNQAELIAGRIAEHLHIPMRSDLIVRARSGTPQADIIDRSSRISNAVGLFAPAIEPYLAVQSLSTVLLVDDVSTTGATLNAASTVLKTSGIDTAVGCVFARG